MDETDPPKRADVCKRIIDPKAGRSIVMSPVAALDCIGKNNCATTTSASVTWLLTHALVTRIRLNFPNSRLAPLVIQFGFVFTNCKDCLCATKQTIFDTTGAALVNFNKFELRAPSAQNLVDI